MEGRVGLQDEAQTAIRITLIEAAIMDDRKSLALPTRFELVFSP